MTADDYSLGMPEASESCLRMDAGLGLRIVAKKRGSFYILNWR
jgi:hypothetical protein